MFKALFSKSSKQKPAPYGWSGDYRSWEQVKAKTGGYDEGGIIRRTREALLQVKSGAAVYERDAVLFDEKIYPHALIAFLKHSVALKKQPLNIVDFGGSLGSTYYQIIEFLTPDVCESWTVVEQEHYVKVGKADFEDGKLCFSSSIADCAASRSIDFVLISGSLQYLEAPYIFLEQLLAYNFDFLLFDRTAFHQADTDRLTLQTVPPEIYEASYPAWFFGRTNFLSRFKDKYRMIAEFPTYVPGEDLLYIDGRPGGNGKGFYFINTVKYPN
ncbi:hypothetical protein PBAL39_19874 [Pedobacter sp. BAL39]|uniref:methyltransferase, TIGR04325 family n=1 Tax=Pedobacter sp. BAL39 TaxID=391596 RepID=UPI0001559643|nr:methyltransferase, TIGR04325 family [Pedobacter sp. BAL39]EDM36176.1 hypothetical protein PBAL39_19874 [Pedobacter sp. BAL39]